MLTIPISILIVIVSNTPPQVLGFSPAADDSIFLKNDRTHAYSSFPSKMRAIGSDFNNISFTENSRVCEDNSLVFTNSHKLFEYYVDLSVEFPHEGRYYVCATGDTVWHHQGLQTFVTVVSNPHLTIPLWINIVLIIICLMFSAVFSGLNLGLMSLNLIELEIFEHSGSETEKAYARKIKPVRKHGNYLLSTILFGNVFVMTTVTILLDEILGSGYLAGIISAMFIVVIGEIIPQAICSRNALMIGAKTIWLTKFFMIVTFPLSFPVSTVLTWAIGENIGRGYNNEQLMALISIETRRNVDYRNNEMDIINGALQIGKKTVGDVMTYIDNVFMLSYDSVLDFETLQKISSMGFTRIPIFRGTTDDIVSILNVKNLMVADPEDRLPLRTICDFYAHQLLTVPENTPLDYMLKVFITAKSHMAIIRRSDKTCLSVVVGILTLEDIIEEIIQAEIIDETDTIIDNRSRIKRVIPPEDLTQLGTNSTAIPILTPMINGVMLFLRSIKPFGEQFISDLILERMVRKCLSSSSGCASDYFIYQKNQIIDYFVLIVSGKLEVTVGFDEMKFEIGPFSYFGIEALSENKPNPQCYFVLKAIGDVQYIMITSYQYNVAVRTTTIARQGCH